MTKKVVILWQLRDRHARKFPGAYNVGAAKAHLSEILDLVEQTGKEVLLTRRGRPVARLVPVPQGVSIVGAGQDDPNINHEVIAKDKWWGALSEAETQDWYG
jgi:prevent-host-death family protein